MKQLSGNLKMLYIHLQSDLAIPGTYTQEKLKHTPNLNTYTQMFLAAYLYPKSKIFFF